MPNGKPSLEDCANAFSRIVDILDGEFDADTEDDCTHDGMLKEVSDIAAGFWHDIKGGSL